jgi:pyrroline-5-carboxylate reductase
VLSIFYRFEERHMLADKKLAFIGSGVMGEAMIKGLLRQKLVKADHLIAADVLAERGQTLAERYGVQWTTGNREAVQDRDIVVLSTKPQVMGEILPELRGAIPRRTLVLSIAAGVPIQTICQGLGHDAVVRAMPNTPGQIGEGITVWAATEKVTEDQLGYAQAILGALGETIRVDHENELDMATALSGTGPAYVLLFMEAMIDAGVHLGFSRRVSEKLVIQTMRGTIEYARQSPRHPATLRNEVTSPGGTSAEALYYMEKGGLRIVVSRAIWAAYGRSVALGGGAPPQRVAGRSPEED